MIDYDKPDEDAIVADVRKAREEVARSFNYDLRTAFHEMRRRQTSSGRTYASLPPRPTTSPTKKAG